MQKRFKHIHIGKTRIIQQKRIWTHVYKTRRVNVTYKDVLEMVNCGL